MDRLSGIVFANHQNFIKTLRRTVAEAVHITRNLYQCGRYIKDHLFTLIGKECRDTTSLGRIIIYYIPCV